MRKNRYRTGRKRIVLTQHLKEKWVERFGLEPSEADIVGILQRGALASESRAMAYPDGRRWVSPGMYIDFERQVALLTDETPQNSVRVITFLSREDMRAGRGRTAPVLRAVGIGNR